MEKNGIIKRYLLLLLSLLFCMSGISDNTIKKELKRINGKLYICYNDSKHMSLVNEEIVTVKLKPQTTLDKGLIVVRSNRLGYIDLRVPRGMDVVDFEECLENSGLYEIVKYADIAETCLTPNDSYITNQWYLSTINMFNAWNISTGSSSIKVAVLDREVDWSHEDLGYGTDGYTHVDWQSGYNYMENTNNAVTPHYHGTMVAGIIGAKTNNAKGIAGISGGDNTSGITIIPYCVGSIEGPNNIDMTTVDDAILDAVDQGVKVINMSFRSKSFYQPDVDNAIQYAHENGVTLIAATGNDYTSTVYYPASHSYVVAVGATSQNNMRCDFSNYGVGLDLVAPGKDIYSTVLQNDYDHNSGTSFAAPQVSGVAALMLSVNPSLTPSAIKQILVGTCQKLTNTYTFNSNGWNNEVGYGLLNAYAAVCAAKASLTGSTVLCNSNVYSISNLPTGASVSWSLASGNTSCVSLQSNNPSTNQCTLTLTNASGFNQVMLQADIVMNGTTVRTIKKMIGKALPFSGTYEEAAGYYNGSSTPAISQTTITDPSGIDVYIGGMVTVRSTYFLGKTITTTGPYGYYNRTGNRIDFSLCSQNEYQPFTIIVHEQGCDDEVRLVFLPCITLDGLNLGITPVGSRSYEVSLSRKKAETTEETSMDKEDVMKGKTWTLEAYNAITARKATSIELKEPTYLLDTTGWESGLYLLRAIVGENVLVGKISVK